MRPERDPETDIDNDEDDQITQSKEEIYEAHDILKTAYIYKK